MNRSLFFVLFQLFIAGVVFAQPGSDSTIIPHNDSATQYRIIAHKDSLTIPRSADSNKLILKDSSLNIIDTVSINNLSGQILHHHPGMNLKTEPSTIHTDIKQFRSKDLLFYVIISLLLIYALLQRAFSKYFNDLFRLFFRTTLKQLQVREQMIQTPLPSFLVNTFFMINGGLYISFLLLHGQLIQQNDFWRTFFYCTIGLSSIYFVKFLGLKMSGWLFNMKEATDAYIFIVFIINKMIGLLLLPFLVLLAYTQGSIYYASLVLSWLIVAGMLIYRFVLTYSAVRKQVKVNPFHFFLYLCAFEIAPLLLIYKGLLLFFHITA